MTKIKVYIDFEAITSPFTNEIKKRTTNIPYAYTIGIIVGNKFKTRTHIVDFGEVSIDDLDADLRYRIIKDIKFLLKNRQFQVSRNSIEFHAFAYHLEKTILETIFKGIAVKDIAKGNIVSLEKVTEREMPQKDYFFEFKKVINKNLAQDFIKRKGLEKTGAIASLAGYVLYANSVPGYFRYSLPINNQVLLKEIRNYSKDDVIRMKYIIDDYDKFLLKVKKWKVIVKKSIIQNKEIADTKKVISYLEKEAKGRTVEVILKELKQKSKKLNKRKLKDDVL